MKKAASQPPFCVRDLDILLADVAPAVFALEPCAGLTDEAVAGGVAVMPAVVPVGIVGPAVVAVLINRSALIIAGVGISRSLILAIGVRIELRTIAGIVN